MVLTWGRRCYHYRRYLTRPLGHFCQLPYLRYSANSATAIYCCPAIAAAPPILLAIWRNSGLAHPVKSQVTRLSSQPSLSSPSRSICHSPSLSQSPSLPPSLPPSLCLSLSPSPLAQSPRTQIHLQRLHANPTSSIQELPRHLTPLRRTTRKRARSVTALHPELREPSGPDKISQGTPTARRVHRGRAARERDTILVRDMTRPSPLLLHHHHPRAQAGSPSP